MDLKKAKYADTGVWLLAALLVVLLLLTWTLLAGLLGRHAAPRETIALTPEESGKTLYQTLYRPVAGEPGVQTQDETVQWESTTDIDLFRESYTNAQGATTVKSQSGGKIIAPGTTDLYTFSIRNTGNTVLDYTVSLDSAFALTDRKIPLQFRLRRGSEWLVGDADRWCGLEEIDAFSGSSTLNPEKIDEYLLEWQWPFEGEDGADTALGSISLNANASFHMTITTTAEAAANAPAVNGDGELLYERRITGGQIVLLVLDIGVLVGILLLILWRRKVCLTGFAPAFAGEFTCGRKKDTLRPDGRFLFPGVCTGKHTFALNGQKRTWRLKRKCGVAGIRFDGEDTVLMGRNIRALELYLLPDLDFDRGRWAAIDGKNRVYSPAGIREPDENGENSTAGGLRADKNRNYSVVLREMAKK